MLLIPKKQQPTFFDGVEWVLKAAPKSYHKTELNRVHIINDELMGLLQATCCDGHRVHRFTLDRAKVEDIKDGLYIIHKNTKSEIQLLKDDDREATDYPNMDEVMKSNKSNLEGHTDYTKVNDNPLSVSWAYTEVIRNCEEDRTFLIDYFTDLYSFPAGIYSTLKLYKTGVHPLQLETDSCLGFLLPIKKELQE